MSLSTPPITASSKTETQTSTAKSVDSNLSDVVRTALPIIAMLAGFVFLPLGGALLLTSVIIGGYVYYDCSDKKTIDKTGAEKPPVPAEPTSEASKVPSTESMKKKHRKISDTPPPSASKCNRAAKSRMSPKSSEGKREPLSSTPLRPKTESTQKKTPSTEDKFGMEAKRLMRQSSDSDEEQPVISPGRRKPRTPARKKSEPSEIAEDQSSPPSNTLFTARFGPEPTAISFEPKEPNMLTPPPVNDSLLQDTPLTIRFSPVPSDPPYTEPRIQPQRRLRLPLTEMFDKQCQMAANDNKSASSEEEPVSHTPKLNTGLPPLHPRSNKATDVRNKAIAAKFQKTPKSRKKRSSSFTPARVASGSETDESAKVRASSDAELSDTPKPSWNASTNPNSKKKK